MKTEFTCLICGEKFIGKHFSNHLAKVHDLKAEVYTIQYVLKLFERPKCEVPNCPNPVRYVSLGFKRFCKCHLSEASAAGGKVGGKIKKTWNKGKTRAEDPRIHVVTGELNPMFGRHHTSETRAKMSGPRAPYKTKSPECIIQQSHELESFLLSIPESIITTLSIPSPVYSECHSIHGKNCANIYVYDLHNRMQYSDWRGDDIKHTPHELHDAGISQGSKVIQFFSDEWRDHRSICESMIRNRLNIGLERIGARECELVELSASDAIQFFEQSHIDGYTRCSIRFGLRDKGGRIISALSLRTPIQKKHGHVCELARFATLPGTVCPGGAARLLKRAMVWAKEIGFNGVLSYADLRFGEGGVYQQLGFERIGSTGIPYFYTDGEVRYDRFKYRAQPGKSEKIVAEENNVRQVHGVGHAIYLTKFV